MNRKIRLKGKSSRFRDIVCVCVCVLIAHSVSVEADILKQLMLVITLEEWIEGSATGAFWGWFINS